MSSSGLAVPPNMAVVVNGGTERSISTIDTATDTAFGPFLYGMLGAPVTELLDVVVTPDGNTAIVSNFADRRLCFINLTSSPPSLLGSVILPIRPADLALSPDGRFVLVTSGAAATAVFSVDVARRSLVAQLNLTGGKHAEAVAIAPDGQTVLVADTEGSQIHMLQLNPNGTLSETQTSISVDGRPVNVAISPDGKTAVVSNCLTPDGRSVSDTVTILRLDSLVKTGTISGLPRFQQGAVFTPDGTKVLVISIVPTPDQLSILNVAGPGMVTDSGQRVDLLSNTGGFYGVDVIAVAPDGTKAYVGNPGGGDVASRVAVIDLTTTPPVLRSTTLVPIPYGIAFPRAGG